MLVVSVTRMRLRRWRDWPAFLLHSVRSKAEAVRAEGCVAVDVRRAHGAFWTMSVWRTPESLRGFMLSGSHRKVMPRLAAWSDEASMVRFEHPDGLLPSWDQAEMELALRGRTSKVDHPSPAQAQGLTLGEAGRQVAGDAAMAH